MTAESNMNDDEVWAAINDQRQRTVDLLEQLSEDEWAQPSLCAGWTVRDVAAHLTLQQVGLGEALWSTITHPSSIGGLNRMIRVSARIRADRPVEQLIRDIRAMIGSRRHNVGVTNLETLTDILVHGQDIAIPLRRDLAMPTAASAAAASRVWSYNGKGKARVFDKPAVQGLRLVATDLPWSVGAGSEIQGPISALLLLLTGRRVALQRLAGEGAERLRAATVNNPAPGQ